MALLRFPRRTGSFLGEHNPAYIDNGHTIPSRTWDDLVDHPAIHLTHQRRSPSRHISDLNSPDIYHTYQLLCIRAFRPFLHLGSSLSLVLLPVHSFLLTLHHGILYVTAHELFDALTALQQNRLRCKLALAQLELPLISWSSPRVMHLSAVPVSL